MKRPNTCTNLIRAIKSIAGDSDYVRLSRALANVIIGQMLPNGVVKGGSSLMFRYGTAVTRYTRDVDAARMAGHDEYITQLKELLSAGWSGFSANLIEIEPPRPTGIPGAYVMLPYDVKMKYLGRPWLTVRFEIGHNEIGDADEFEETLPDELAAMFELMDFPRPKPIHVMKLAYQVAQKLHAVSEEGSMRAHDLIDLQLICKNSDLDYADIKSKCVRLFNYRRRQQWPPTIAGNATWQSIYVAALDTIADKTGILPTLEEAIAWTNKLIARIDGSDHP